ncbi:tRNA pseudouridine(55) synthase TruB [Alkalinema sp. FACHB-956]|uniref:tRNA pseudouridine(55) synthase TruB n=1 Tax=Alkalinema sp. FACHB-956 TaxID=2692768 RepID=UPI001686F8C0|nr:tRNA pseudouridine(55) synthase TruB [Alkalinema sp. FACHB-956]MBD2330097.1 tRNA pseudouridine(55) synthase TruB [Alkalinema sp. FACHB-956]
MDGFLNLNKPLGMTSHDCISRLRRLLKTKKIGHAGTLDPAADGVLPIAVGRATRLLQFLPTGKAYCAIVRFGVTTNTDDLEGEILTQQAVPQLTLDGVQAAIPQFIGTMQQIPPAFSAIQVQGQRLYDLARSGKAVDVPMRTVEVSAIELLAWRGGEFPEIDLAVACGGGTYIRAIARDLGQAVGTGATLAGLTRTASGGFDLAASVTLETIAQQVEAHEFHLVPPEQVLQHLPVWCLEPELARRWCLGQRIFFPEVTQPIADWVRIHAETGKFLGVSQLETQEDGWLLRPTMVYEPQG